MSSFSLLSLSDGRHEQPDHRQPRMAGERAERWCAVAVLLIAAIAGGVVATLH